MEEPKTQDHTLSLFRAITSFVTSLNECYGPTQKTLQLYARLISKTTVADDTPITRHIKAFTLFCTANKDAILEKNNAKFTDERISYNERVYIDMAHVFKQASNSEKKIIWKHLLSIFALIDPQSKAKDTLKDFLKKDGDGGKETEFLSDIFEKVGTNIDSDGNPLQAVGNLMSSGLFTDIVGSMSSGLESGELDLGKLMGSMQGMVSGIGNMAQQDGHDQPPEMAEMLGQMNAMMGNLNKMTQQADESKSSGAAGSASAVDGEELARKMLSLDKSDTSQGGREINGMSPGPPSSSYDMLEDDTGPKFEVVDESAKDAVVAESKSAKDAAGVKKSTDDPSVSKPKRKLRRKKKPEV